ncbi:MAG: GNAT family N-acetyltransferase [Planctomycetota bacterium]|jgi:GNAT superfamily N-acetyltransferase
MDRAMDVTEKIRQKYREGQLTEAIVKKLKTVLIRRLDQVLKITPFYLYQEGIFRDDWQSFANEFDQYEVNFLGYEDMKEIETLSRGDWSSEERLLGRFNDGEKCFGAKYQGKIAAFTWSNFESCHDKRYKFPLRDDEAYLWDAFTIPSFRGKGIAPYLRFKFYEELQKLGRNTFYSITLCSNKSALRFKKKLNAKPLILAIHVRLLKKWSWSWKIKNYRYDMH